MKEGKQDVFLFHKNLDKAVLRSIPLISPKVDDNDSPLSKSKLKVKIQLIQRNQMRPPTLEDKKLGEGIRVRLTNRKKIC